LSRRSGWLRRVLIWTGPLFTIVVLLVAGFTGWLLATTAGLRWALFTTTSIVGGEVDGVSGSVWHGVALERFRFDNDDLRVDAEGLRLRVAWPSLRQGLLQIEEVAAERLDVALAAAPAADDDEDEAPAVPELPLRVQVDRLALGRFSFEQAGEPLPVVLSSLEVRAKASREGAELVLERLRVDHAAALLDLSGRVSLAALAHPWPFEASLHAGVQAQADDPQLCARHYLPSLPAASEASGDDDHCTLDIHTTAGGSLEQITVVTRGSGQGMQLDAVADLRPGAGFPLEKATLDLVLADASSLRARIGWDADEDAAEAMARDRIHGRLQSERLDLAGLLGGALPSAVLSTEAEFELWLVDRSRPEAVRIDLAFAPDSVWNDAPLSGHLRAALGLPSPPGDDAGIDLAGVRLQALDVDLQLGGNQVRADGSLGGDGDALALQVEADRLAGFWPGLPGGLRLAADIQGGLAQHALALDARYIPPEARDDRLGQAPAHVALGLEGDWDAAAGWTGRLQGLTVHHAGLRLSVDGRPALSFAPEPRDDAPQWQVGPAGLHLALDDKPILDVRHEASYGLADGRMGTQGRVEQLVVGAALVDDIQKLMALAGVDSPGLNKADPARGGVKTTGRNWRRDVKITMGLDWDLEYGAALAGRLQLRRLDGDIMVPADPPFRLGLQDLALEVTARAQEGGSRIDAQLELTSRRMGHIKAGARSLLLFPPGGAPAVSDEGVALNVDAAVENLAWVSLFTGDAMEFGGKLDARLAARVRMDGSWDGTGEIHGSELKVVRVDDGLRLLDGSLEARLEQDRLLLEKLEFPAKLRVMPKDRRVAQWLETPEAAGGALRVSGDWRLDDMAGDIKVALDRYPVLQRTDRFIMGSGDIAVAVRLPALAITGGVRMDAGWADLDMLGNVPTLDGDVVIVHHGDTVEEVDVPMDISMALDVDMGRRFYLTGYGVDSGLTGKLHVSMIKNRLTAVGALETRGGVVEAYGQRLELSRGTVTFQGDIGNPVLAIEAVRKGLSVEAGVKVAGTGKRPRIDLISYPEVSEIEKLSWLLFGHGPDDSRGDMALLLSVGTSFLGDGEPFYRKFGIDEVGLRSGELGSAGSILPVESVVSGLNSGANDLERQFILVSKGVSRGFTLSLRQALSDAGTVGRVSYRLARNLTAELSVGSVNGLALVWRWFSRD